MSISSIQGKRDYMEDYYFFGEKYGIIIAFVCDGHGGYQAAKVTKDKLPSILFQQITPLKGSIIDHAKKIRSILLEWGSVIKNYDSGSTLTGILIKNATVYFYNIGDSRTCVETKPRSHIYLLKPLFDGRGRFYDKIAIEFYQNKLFCTVDHDPSNSYELHRINSAGGVITNGRLNGILSLTRSFGDKDIGDGLSYVPDVYWISKENINGPIFIYSDGLYELDKDVNKGIFTVENLYELAKEYNPETIVNYIYESGSEDNITAMIVRL